MLLALKKTITTECIIIILPILRVFYRNLLLLYILYRNFCIRIEKTLSEIGGRKIEYVDVVYELWHRTVFRGVSIWQELRCWISLTLRYATVQNITCVFVGREIGSILLFIILFFFFPSSINSSNGERNDCGNEFQFAELFLSFSQREVLRIFALSRFRKSFTACCFAVIVLLFLYAFFFGETNNAGAEWLDLFPLTISFQLLNFC